MKEWMKPGRGRWRRRALIVLGAFAALLVGLILIADTAWVKGRLLAAVNRRLKDGFGLTLSVGEFHLRLPSLSATLKDVRVKPLDPASSTPLAFSADEVFVTGTAAEVAPIVLIDGRSIGSGRPGPVTRQLMAAFKTVTETEGYPINKK